MCNGYWSLRKEDRDILKASGGFGDKWYRRGTQGCYLGRNSRRIVLETRKQVSSEAGLPTERYQLFALRTNTFTEHMLCAEHCSKHFVCIILCNIKQLYELTIDFKWYLKKTDIQTSQMVSQIQRACLALRVSLTLRSMLFLHPMMVR